MKKIIFATLLGVMMALSVGAQEQKQEAAKPNCQVIYAEDNVDGDKVISPKYYIDRTAKKIYFDDPTDPSYIENPEDLQKMIIKSVKKEGNTETFILSNGYEHEATFKLVLVLNTKLTSKDDLSSQTSTFTAGHTDSKDVSNIMIYDQLPDEEKENIEATRKFKEQQAAGKAAKPAVNSGAAKKTEAGAAEAKVEEPATPGQKAKDGVNNLLNKGKNLFKKK